jgi:protein-tyrosine-phosphatase
MKVLFVCNANIGRSQVAQAYFNNLTQHDSDCAGINADEATARRNLPSRKMKDVPGQRSVHYIRREFGVGQDDDFAHNVYRQVQDRVEQLVKEIG